MAVEKTITKTQRSDRNSPFQLEAPDRSGPHAGLVAWNDLDHALHQLNSINDIAMELQPEIRKLAVDGPWCADRMAFCNGAVTDYATAARAALNILQASAYGTREEIAK